MLLTPDPSCRADESVNVPLILIDHAAHTHKECTPSQVNRPMRLGGSTPPLLEAPAVGVTNRVHEVKVGTPGGVTIPATEGLLLSSGPPRRAGKAASRSAEKLYVRPVGRLTQTWNSGGHSVSHQDLRLPGVPTFTLTMLLSSVRPPVESLCSHSDRTPGPKSACLAHLPARAQHCVVRIALERTLGGPYLLSRQRKSAVLPAGHAAGGLQTKPRSIIERAHLHELQPHAASHTSQRSSCEV